MKWEKLKPPEPDDSMCCCECDVSPSRCCCDCDSLDKAFKRWLREKGRSGGFHSPLLGAVIENLEISLVPALLLLPLLLRVAALHFLLGITILTALPILVLWYYYATHRRRRRTLFFLSLALYSLGYMYYLFITEILPRGDVSRLQVCVATAGMILTLIFLIRTKRGPGFISRRLGEVKNHNNGDEKKSSGSLKLEASFSSESPSKNEENALTTWSKCPVCKIMRPPRAGHCRSCGSCVLRLDHHCIWINSCVGQANHRSFLLTLCVYVLTAVYGISLVLRSICPQQHLMIALLYCPGVYSQSSTALCFTCAWYSSIITGGLLYLLLAQILNISFNVTEREAQLALRTKKGRRRLFGLVVYTGEFSRGFYQNWVEFLTTGEASRDLRFSLTDFV